MEERKRGWIFIFVIIIIIVLVGYLCLRKCNAVRSAEGEKLEELTQEQDEEGIEELSEVAEENVLSGWLDFFGMIEAYSFSGMKPESKILTPEYILKRNKLGANKIGLRGFLEQIFKDFEINNNDLAKILCIVSFVNSIDYPETAEVLTISQIIDRSKINDVSRILLASALCQSFGLAVVPVSDNKNDYYLATTFRDDERLEPLTANASFESEGRRFYLFDLSLRNPIGFLFREPGIRFKIIGGIRQGNPIRIYPDELELPDFSEEREDREIEVSGDFNSVEYQLSFYLKKNLRDYVSNLPLSIPLLFAYASIEINETGVISDIETYISELNSEVERVNFLLFIVQDSDLTNFYKTKIRPATVTLFEKKSDCDTRSIILAGLLYNCGIERVIVLEAPRHLCLAVAPEESETKIPEGKFVNYKDSEYYILDAAILKGGWGRAMESGGWKVLLDMEKIDALLN